MKLTFLRIRHNFYPFKENNEMGLEFQDIQMFSFWNVAMTQQFEG